MNWIEAHLVTEITEGTTGIERVGAKDARRLTLHETILHNNECHTEHCYE